MSAEENHSGIMPAMRAVLIPLILILLASSAANAEAIAGRASVIDADTLDIHGARIRLLDIDAPESRQPCRRPDGAEWRCGQQAALALADWIGARPVTCETSKRDNYRRWLARCSVGSADLAEWLASQGWGVPYRECRCATIRAASADAQTAQRGIWSGTFAMPWDWRAQQAKQAAPEPSAEQPTAIRPGASQNAGGCLIKGNINSKGEHIYHVPGGKWYDKTQIDTSKGERWFCSEADARAAGWRPAKI